MVQKLVLLCLSMQQLRNVIYRLAAVRRGKTTPPLHIHQQHQTPANISTPPVFMRIYESACLVRSYVLPLAPMYIDATRDTKLLLPLPSNFFHLCIVRNAYSPQKLAYAQKLHYSLVLVSKGRPFHAHIHPIFCVHVSEYSTTVHSTDTLTCYALILYMKKRQHLEKAGKHEKI